MADQNDERKLEELLDSALSEYSAVEPRPGLEGRILARIQDAAEQPQAQWWSTRWLLAGGVAAAVAAIVLSVWLFWPEHKPIQQVKRDIAPLNQAQASKNLETTATKSHRQRKSATVTHKESHEEHPRQELARGDRPAVFPTPTGLSEQEKLMLAYVEQTPKEELMAQLRSRDFEKEEFWKDPQPAAFRSQR
ncbi:MAG TPA: hypothetical protein VFB76_09180 [Candidatus Angelobacter sp.]|nr:hypothetical protein [Candidatus Angelobacter sp.]